MEKHERCGEIGKARDARLKVRIEGLIEIGAWRNLKLLKATGVFRGLFLGTPGARRGVGHGSSMEGAKHVVETASRCDPGAGGCPVGLTGLPDTIRGGKALALHFCLGEYTDGDPFP